MRIGSSCDSLSLPDVHVYEHTAKYTWLNRYTKCSSTNVSVHVHHLGPWPSSIWSSGEFPVSQAWAACFGLFKLPIRSSTQDRGHGALQNRLSH